MKCVVDQRREADRPMVCDPCRRGLASDLRELVDAYAVLGGQPEPVASRLLVEDDGSFDGPMVYDVLDLGSGPVRAPNGSARVSGSREAPVPVSLDLVDLTGEARSGRVRDTLVPMVETRPVTVVVRRVDIVVVEHEERNAAGELVKVRERVPVNVEEEQTRTERVPVHGGFGEPVMAAAADQIGLLPVATILDQWVRDWIDTRGHGEHLPVPTVVTLADWLGKRLDWACDEHPAVDDFAVEIRSLLRSCRRMAGDGPVRPEPLVGVPCATTECDGLLLHYPASKYWAECGLCGRLWSEDEYREWVGLVAAAAKRRAA